MIYMKLEANIIFYHHNVNMDIAFSFTFFYLSIKNKSTKKTTIIYNSPSFLHSQKVKVAKYMCLWKKLTNII